MELTNHIGRVRAWMEENNYDAFIIEGCDNVTWLTMFDGIEDHEDPHTIVITPTVARYYTDSRYLEVSQRGAANTEWDVVCDLEDRVETVGRDFTQLKRIAVEGSMPVARYNKYTGKVAGEFVPVGRTLEDLRAVKDEREIELIRHAQMITDDTFAHLCEWMKVGMTEAEVALELEFFMRGRGSNGVAFDSIVAAGANGALPHAHPGAYRIQEGDMLTLDFGARYGAYRSDMTRTVVFGKANDKQREVYETVRAANLAAIDACKAGMSGKELHDVAAKVIDDAGYGEYFNHGLGHGVGIEIHEQPNAGVRGSDSLPANSILTIEPGIYISGFGGVRIEDMVIVTANGCEVITKSPKDLIEL